MCMDMHLGIRDRHAFLTCMAMDMCPSRHVSRHAYGTGNGHVYRDMYRHVHRHVQWTRVRRHVYVQKRRVQTDMCHGLGV